MNEFRMTDCSRFHWKKIAAALHDAFPAISGKEIAYQLKNYRKSIRIFWSGDDIAGFTLSLHGKSPGMTWLQQIVVAKQYQRQGVGKLLLNDFEKQSLSHGYQRVELAVRKDNYAAIRLYASCGYSMIPREGEGFTFGKELPVVTGTLKRGYVNPHLPSFFERILNQLVYKLIVG